ncbi:MAG: hypothetical protein QM482_07280 [Sulfurospirillum sp.]
MIKKIVLSASSVVMLSAFGFGNIVGAVTGVKTDSTASNSSTKDKHCIPRMSGGSTSLTQMVTKKVLSLAIESALKSVAGAKNIQIPTPLTNTCEADKRLKYLKTITGDFENNIANANEDILASVSQTKEIQILQEEIAHKKKSLKEAEYRDSVIEDNTKLLKLIGKAKIKDKAKYSAAMGKLAIATPITGYMVLAWDKEILEFAKDNMIWGIQHVSDLTTIASQLKTTISVLPTLTSLVTSPLYNGKVNKNIAKRAANKAIKTDKKIASEAEAELDGLDS